MMAKDALQKGKLAIKEGTLVLEVDDPKNVGIELTLKLDALKRKVCSKFGVKTVEHIGLASKGSKFVKGRAEVFDTESAWMKESNRNYNFDDLINAQNVLTFLNVTTKDIPLSLERKNNFFNQVQAFMNAGDK